MDNEGNAEATEISTGTSGVDTGADVAAQSGSFINADGTLKEGWQNSDLIPTDFKGRPVYGAVGNTVADLLKHIGNQDIAISRQGKGIFPPGPNATQTEKDLFYKAVGRPDKLEGYNFKPPKELEKYYTDAGFLVTSMQRMHQKGLTPEQFNEVMAIDAERMLASEQELKDNPLPYYEELLPIVQPLLKEQAETELRAKWGDSYDARLHLADRAIAENTAEGEERDALLARVGNDPMVADFIATIMNKHYTSGMGVNTSLGAGATAMNVQQQIDSIMKNPIYTNANLNPKEHDRLVNEVNRLLSLQTGGKMLE